MKKLLIVAGLILAFTACKKENDLTIANEQELTQTAFADEETTKGFTFTAKSDWTATVKGVTTSKGSGVSWLTLLHKGVETYSGSAGTFTMEISLTPNSTGQTRTATIEIVSGKDKITITVAQSGTPVGDVYLLSEIINPKYGSSRKFEYDNQNRIAKITEEFNVQIFNYNSAGDLISIRHERQGTHRFTYTFTKSGNKITIPEGEDSGELTLNTQGVVEKLKYSWETRTLLCQYQGKNLIKIISEESSEDIITFTYDDKKSPFYYCNTPQWWLVWYQFATGFTLGYIIGHENNIETYSSKTICQYTYNDNGFPITQNSYEVDYPENVYKLEFKYEKK